MEATVKTAPPKSEVRHIRFTEETLVTLEEFSRMWDHSSLGVTIGLGFKILKELAESGKLRAEFAPILLSTSTPPGADE